MMAAPSLRRVRVLQDALSISKVEQRISDHLDAADLISLNSLRQGLMGPLNQVGCAHNDEPVPRFLDPEESLSYHVALVSYPRSGNSLVRRMLEKITGIVTGSDTRPDRTLSRALKAMGMKGEGIVDGRVHIVKSHYPERHGYQKFKADKVIVLVRNPFDAIESYFNLGFTNTHTETLHDDAYQWLAPVWEALAPNELEVWAAFHRWWAGRGVPRLTLRYEDLRADPRAALRRASAFLLGLPGPEAIRPGMAAWDAVEQAVASGTGGRGSGPYRPRPKQGGGGGGGGGGRGRWSAAQLAAAAAAHGPALRQYGYLLHQIPSDDEGMSLPPHWVLDIQTDIPEGAYFPGDPQSFLTINRAPSVRKSDDIFGRNITKVRKKFTGDDQYPLPVLGWKHSSGKEPAKLERKETGKDGEKGCKEPGMLERNDNGKGEEEGGSFPSPIPPPAHHISTITREECCSMLEEVQTFVRYILSMTKSSTSTDTKLLNNTNNK